LKQLQKAYGPYSEREATKDYHRFLMGESTAHVLELNYHDKHRIHNLKYFTWVEQQGRELSELESQWYDFPEYWENVHRQVDEIDDLIDQFNQHTRLLEGKN
jgi:hypothetical protein